MNSDDIQAVQSLIGWSIALILIINLFPNIPENKDEDQDKNS
jgi:hypothetical protein